jgi:hypothetical protein
MNFFKNNDYQTSIKNNYLNMKPTKLRILLVVHFFVCISSFAQSANNDILKLIDFE